MQLLIAIVGFLGFYEFLAWLTRYTPKKVNTSKLYEDARLNRLRIIHQRGDLDLHEPSAHIRFE